MSTYKVIEDASIESSSAKAMIVKKGQVFRISVPEGPTVGDFVSFCLDDLNERFDQARTKVDNGKIYVTKGDKLYSKANTVMFTIIADTYGTHDLQYGMCSKWVFENVPALHEYALKVGRLGIPLKGCWENLTVALEPWKISKYDIPSPLNVFQTVSIDTKTGKMENLAVHTKTDDHIDFRAEVDCLCAVANSPMFGYKLRLQVLEPQP